MNDALKKCPYCAEEINIAAIKCKHCGEFLDLQFTSANSSSHSVGQTIAPQNFQLAISVAISSIILSFIPEFMEETDKGYLVFFLLYLTVTIRFWFYLRTYLQNFKQEKVIALVNWNIILTFALGISFIGLILFPTLDSDYTQFSGDSLFRYNIPFLFFLILSIIVYIASIYIYIRTGIVLQKIKNDFVGMLKELGMSISYLLPITILIGGIRSFTHNHIIGLLGDVIEAVPYVIVILIFARAQKYIKKDEPENSSPIEQTTEKKINNTFVWLLAFTPIIAFIAGPFVFFILTISLALFDNMQLIKAGHKTHILILAFLFFPSYLWRRAILTNQSKEYFWVWIITFFISIFLIFCVTNSAQNEKEFLITATSIGKAKLGHTIEEFKNNYKDYQFTEEPVSLYGVDGSGNGIKVSKNNEDLLFVWTLDASNKIKCINALSDKYHTIDGLKPTMTAGELNDHFPNMTVQESMEYSGEEYFVDSEMMFVFVSIDSTRVGTYKETDSPSKSNVVNRGKKLTRIEILTDNQ